MRMVQSSQRETTDTFAFLAESLAANLVALINQLHQKSAVRLPAFKVAASTQHQFLIHGRLESVVTLLHVAVLVGLTRLGVGGPKMVVIEQSLIAGGELIRIFRVVDRGRQAVGPMFPGYASQLPQCVLQPADRLSNDSEKHTVTVSQFEYARTK